MSVKHLYLIAVAALVGCTPAGSTSDRPGSPPAPRRGSYLSAEEIAAANADVGTAYDALSRLRANWLAPHGAMSSNPQVSDFATVYLDGQLYGDVNTLRTIAAYHVADMRYYNITEAGARFGVRAGAAGVIEVRSKTR